MSRARSRARAARIAGAALLYASLLASACDAEVASIGGWEAPDARAPARSLYLEAEDGELSGGFTIEDDATASGDRAIAAPPGAGSEDAPGDARARYELPIPSAGEYLLWGRIHGPGPDNNRFWFQLDGGDFYKWRISTGDIWYWDDFHDDRTYGRPLVFELEAGEHELVIASCVEGVRLDRLYVTAEGDEPPGNDTTCDPPHSIDRAGECLPSCGILQGTTCGPGCEGRAPLPAYDCDVCCRIDG